MKRLRFLYHMEIAFDMPVKEHHFTLKCFPRDNKRQHVESLAYDVWPKRFISRSEDSFGNECIYGLCEEPHREFMIDVNGIAECGHSDHESECAKTEADIFKYQTEHTLPGKNIGSYHGELLRVCPERHGTTSDRVRLYMNSLHKDYAYQSGSTQISTTAEEAFSQGCGVCQDFVHILLSLLRMDQIPCRYVTGMMLGEGLSHAWVEYFAAGKWIAVDPTNDVMVVDDHIRIAAGRDYRDCLINQGIFVGCDGKTEQKQSIRVHVEEAGSWI